MTRSFCQPQAVQTCICTDSSSGLLLAFVKKYIGIAQTMGSEAFEYRDEPQAVQSNQPCWMPRMHVSLHSFLASSTQSMCTLADLHRQA